MGLTYATSVSTPTRNGLVYGSNVTSSTNQSIVVKKPSTNNFNREVNTPTPMRNTSNMTGAEKSEYNKQLINERRQATLERNKVNSLNPGNLKTNWTAIKQQESAIKEDLNKFDVLQKDKNNNRNRATTNTLEVKPTYNQIQPSLSNILGGQLQSQAVSSSQSNEEIFLPDKFFNKQPQSFLVEKNNKPTPEFLRSFLDNQHSKNQIDNKVDNYIKNNNINLKNDLLDFRYSGLYTPIERKIELNPTNYLIPDYPNSVKAHEAAHDLITNGDDIRMHNAKYYIINKKGLKPNESGVFSNDDWYLVNEELSNGMEEFRKNPEKYKKENPYLAGIYEEGFSLSNSDYRDSRNANLNTLLPKVGIKPNSVVGKIILQRPLVPQSLPPGGSGIGTALQTSKANLQPSTTYIKGMVEDYNKNYGVLDVRVPTNEKQSFGFNNFKITDFFRNPVDDKREAIRLNNAYENLQNKFNLQQQQVLGESGYTLQTTTNNKGEVSSQLVSDEVIKKQLAYEDKVNKLNQYAKQLEEEKIELDRKNTVYYNELNKYDRSTFKDEGEYNYLVGEQQRQNKVAESYNKKIESFQKSIEEVNNEGKSLELDNLKALEVQKKLENINKEKAKVYEKAVKSNEILANADKFNYIENKYRSGVKEAASIITEPFEKSIDRRKVVKDGKIQLLPTLKNELEDRRDATLAYTSGMSGAFGTEVSRIPRNMAEFLVVSPTRVAQKDFERNVVNVNGKIDVEKTIANYRKDSSPPIPGLPANPIDNYWVRGIYDWKDTTKDKDWKIKLNENALSGGVDVAVLALSAAAKPVTTAAKTAAAPVVKSVVTPVSTNLIGKILGVGKTGFKGSVKVVTSPLTSRVVGTSVAVGAVVAPPTWRAATGETTWTDAVFDMSKAAGHTAALAAASTTIQNNPLRTWKVEMPGERLGETVTEKAGVVFKYAPHKEVNLVGWERAPKTIVKGETVNYQPSTSLNKFGTYGRGVSGDRVVLGENWKYTLTDKNYAAITNSKLPLNKFNQYVTVGNKNIPVKYFEGKGYISYRGKIYDIVDNQYVTVGKNVLEIKSPQITGSGLEGEIGFKLLTKNQNIVNPKQLVDSRGLNEEFYRISGMQGVGDSNKIITDIKNVNQPGLKAIMDTAKQQQAEIYGSFASKQYISQDLWDKWRGEGFKGYPGDVDLMIHTTQAHADKVAAQLAKDLKATGNEVRIADSARTGGKSLIQIKTPDNKWVNAVDIHSAETVVPNIPQEGFLGTPFYGSKLGVTNTLARNKYMPFGELAVRKSASALSIRQGPSGQMGYYPELHRLKDTPDMLMHYEQAARWRGGSTVGRVDDYIKNYYPGTQAINSGEQSVLLTNFRVPSQDMKRFSDLFGRSSPGVASSVSDMPSLTPNVGAINMAIPSFVSSGGLASELSGLSSLSVFASSASLSKYLGSPSKYSLSSSPSPKVSESPSTASYKTSPSGSGGYYPSSPTPSPSPSPSYPIYPSPSPSPSSPINPFKFLPPTLPSLGSLNEAQIGRYGRRGTREWVITNRIAPIAEEFFARQQFNTNQSQKPTVDEGYMKAKGAVNRMLSFKKLNVNKKVVKSKTFNIKNII